MANNNYYRNNLPPIEREILTQLIEPHVRVNAWDYGYLENRNKGQMDAIVADIADFIYLSAARATVRVIKESEEVDVIPQSTNCTADVPGHTSPPPRLLGKVLPCLTVVEWSGGTRSFFWQRGASAEPDQVGEELFSMDKDGWPKGGVLAQYFSVRVLLAAALQGPQSGVITDGSGEEFDSQLRTAFKLFCDNRRMVNNTNYNPTREYYNNVGGKEENCSDAMYRIVETCEAVRLLEGISIEQLVTMKWEPTPFLSNEERRREDENRLQSTPYWRLWDAWNPSKKAASRPYEKDTYVAVSHVWSGVSDESLRAEILWHSRTTEHRYYWVDKWCIKQMSDEKGAQSDEDKRNAEEEKSHMIPLMGTIYEGATGVLICHDGNFNAELPVDMKPELPLKATDAMKESWRSLHWHRRMWTFQEGALGKRYETMLEGLSRPLDLGNAGLWSRPHPEGDWTRRAGRRGSLTNPFERGHKIQIPEGGPATYEEPDLSMEDFRCVLNPDRRRRPLALLMSEVAGRDCNREEDTLYALWAVALEDLPRPVPGKKRSEIILSLATIGAFGMEVLVGPIGEDAGTGCWVPKHPRNCESWTTPKASALVPAFMDGAWVAIATITLQPSQFPRGPVNHENAQNDMLMVLGTALQPGDRIVLGETYTNILKLDAEDGDKRDEGWVIYWKAVDQTRGHLLKVKWFDL